MRDSLESNLTDTILPVMTLFRTAICLSVRNKRWSSWEDDTKAKGRQAATEARKFQKDHTREQTEEGAAFLREKGMEVDEPTPEELQAFRAATKPAFDSWAAKVGPELVSAFQEAKIGRAHV